MPILMLSNTFSRVIPLPVLKPSPTRVFIWRIMMKLVCRMRLPLWAGTYTIFCFVLNDAEENSIAFAQSLLSLLGFYRMYVPKQPRATLLLLQQKIPTISQFEFNRTVRSECTAFLLASPFPPQPKGNILFVHPIDWWVYCDFILVKCILNSYMPILLFCLVDCSAFTQGPVVVAIGRCIHWFGHRSLARTTS